MSMVGSKARSIVERPCYFQSMSDSRSLKLSFLGHSISMGGLGFPGAKVNTLTCHDYLHCPIGYRAPKARGFSSDVGPTIWKD